MTYSLEVIYSSEKEKKIGNFKNFLQKVQENADFKLLLKTNYYEEIIPVPIIAFTNDLVCGIVTTHTSSSSLEKFNNIVNYNNYKCNFLFFSNSSYAVLRSDFNNAPLESTLYKSKYDYVKWLCKNEKWNLAFSSPSDFQDNEKRKDFIEKIKKGADLKVQVEINGITYVLLPSIKYFNKNNNIDLSIKTDPFITFDDVNNIDKNKIFKLNELIINLDGEISILETIKFATDYKPKQNVFFRLINFIFRKFYLNSKLVKNIKPKHLVSKKKIKWFLK